MMTELSRDPKLVKLQRRTTDLLEELDKVEVALRRAKKAVSQAKEISYELDDIRGDIEQ